MEHCLSALLLIEFQNEWLSPTGKLHELMTDAAQLETAVAAGLAALQASRESNRVQVVHVPCGQFLQGYPAFGAPAHGLRAAIRNAQTWLEGTEGPLFDVRFAPRAGEFVVGGRVGTSAFAGSNLDMYLRNHRISHVYLAGFASHVCVDATMRAGVDPIFRTPNGATMLPESGRWESRESSTRTSSSVMRFG